MKKNKFILASVAAFIVASSIFAVGSQAHTAQAATKTIQTVTNMKDKTEAFAYDKNGHYLYQKKYSLKTNTKYKYYGAPRRIKGQKYICYYIGKGRYIPLDNIQKVNNRNTIRLLRNSYLYNKNGQKLGKLSVRYPVYFAGKLKKTNQDKRYFVINRNWQKNTAQKYYLSYRKIGSSYYYSIGKGRYINTRNVAAINGLQNCSNGEKVTVTAPGKQNVPIYVEADSSDEKTGKWLPGTVKYKGATANQVIIDSKKYYVFADRILGHSIPRNTTITINAKAEGPQYKYQIKGTHLFIDAANVKERNSYNLLPYYDDLDLVNAR